MVFVFESELSGPERTPESEVKKRLSAIGLRRAESEAQLDGVLDALPLSGWMQIIVTPLEPHSDDPASEPGGSTNTALIDATYDIDGGQQLVS